MPDELPDPNYVREPVRPRGISPGVAHQPRTPRRRRRPRRLQFPRRPSFSRPSGALRFAVVFVIVAVAWLHPGFGSGQTLGVSGSVAARLGLVPDRSRSAPLIPSIGSLDSDTARSAYRVADAHWPASPCRGREQVHLAALHGPAGRATIGPGNDNSCAVDLASTPQSGAWTQLMLCAVLEHEFGHLSGSAHSRNPADVMFPSTDGHNAQDCVRAFPTVAAGSAASGN